MALGIGANTAVFSAMNAVLLKSLPVADPQRVLYLRIDGQPDGATNTGNSDSSFSWPVYDALRHQDRAFSDVMAYVPLSFDGKAAVRIDSTPEVAEGDMVSGNFFSGLGVRIARGRGFTNNDERSTPYRCPQLQLLDPPVLQSPDILGKTLFVKGVPLTVVGITAAGFEGTEPGTSVDFWIPLQSRAELNAWGNPAPDGKTYLIRQNWWCLLVLARLAPGATAQQALAQTQAVVSRTAFIGIGQPRVGQKPPIVSFQPAKAFPGYAEQYGTPLKMMMAMVALVLLIALSNVVMLIVARNANRQREFSVRLSLGAGTYAALSPVAHGVGIARRTRRRPRMALRLCRYARARRLGTDRFQSFAGRHRALRHSRHSRACRVALRPRRRSAPRSPGELVWC